MHFKDRNKSIFFFFFDDMIWETLREKKEIFVAKNAAVSMFPFQAVSHRALKKIEFRQDEVDSCSQINTIRLYFSQANILYNKTNFDEIFNPLPDNAEFGLFKFSSK